MASSYAGRKLLGSESKQIQVSDAPKVTSTEFLFPAEPVLGTRGTFTFAARTTGVVAFRYDALVTEVSWTPQQAGEHVLYVQRRFTDGVLSPVREYRLLVG